MAASRCPVSALGEHLARYLAVRRAVGFRSEEHGRALVDFVAFIDAGPGEAITVDATLAWAARASTDQMVARRLSMVRHFARHVVVFDPTTEVPPTNLGPPDPGRQPPYLYGASEVEALMRACRQLEPVAWATGFETMIGLLVATGIRPGEAYRLNRVDVDLDEGRLAVMHTKFGKSRLLPLHPSSVDALSRYCEVRDPIAGRREGAFFLSPTGNRLDSPRATRTMRQLLRRTSISAPAGRRPPRLHDFRHSFAVNTLLDWHRDGADVWAQLPTLSAYLGHLRPANTYWYLEAAPELMALTADRLAASWEARP